MKNELTIFYTDDDQEDLEFFREIVGSISDDWHVVTQSNGPELLHALDNPPPHPYVVMLDINMPGMTGFDVLKALRSQREHKELPIVMFSTSRDEAAIEKSRLLGATYYIPKSGIFENLKKSIEHVLGINWPSFITTDKNFVYSL
ncbi:response regulator [Flavobacterium akiainvivens]|uniref:response regulator n=1 Tax=Flavobacterium akiainvivens TaxID=1202724 RepID=UPI0006C8999B|nr:response regulator [Flavobacterium akiainvivens]SFQ42392.1 CheY chemotaxis protein or a CheY-like REC (receiver) domain [Flavobacterium akiainvivens]